MDKYLYIMQGVQGSGKSFIAGALSEQFDAWIVSADDYFINDDGEYIFDKNLLHEAHTYAFETVASHMKKAQIMNVDDPEAPHIILDNTNISREHVIRYLELAKEYGYKVQCIRVTRELDIAVSEQQHGVPKNVIYKKYMQMDDLLNPNYGRMYRKPVTPVYEENDKESAIICDLDGTLALIGERSPYDASNCHEVDDVDEAVYEILKSMMNTHRIIFVSGREEKYRRSTLKFLTKLFDYSEFDLYMRKTNDSRPDSVIKREVYDFFIEPKFNVLFVIDDRQRVVDMWRSLGIRTFQCNYGDF